MLTKKLLRTSIFLIMVMLFNSGCAAIGAAASAGIGYAIYQATKK